MSHPRDRPVGHSGIFKAIVLNARKLKRAVTGGDDEPSPEATDIGERIAQAFIAGRFGDVYQMGTPDFYERLPRDRFIRRWSDAVAERGALTGFDISSAGAIELQYVPGLEEVPQDQFVAFIELAFSTPGVPLDSDKAFVIGLVLLRYDGEVRLGAMHAR